MFGSKADTTLNRAPKLFTDAFFEVNTYSQPASGDNSFRHVGKNDKNAECLPRSSGKVTLWSILLSLWSIQHYWYTSRPGGNVTNTTVNIFHIDPPIKLPSNHNTPSSATSLPQSGAILSFLSLSFKEQEACEGRETLVVPMEGTVAHSQPDFIPFGQFEHCVVAGCVWLPLCFIAGKKEKDTLFSLYHVNPALEPILSLPSPML